MYWATEALNLLARAPLGHHAGDAPAVETTSLAVLALIGAGHTDQTGLAVNWLSSQQMSDGSLPPYSELKWPGWPTPLAILALAAADSASSQRNAPGLNRARQWLLSAAGNRLQPSAQIGHDVSLVGWPWVLGTHSWQEPTAWSVLALKMLALGDHPRTREGVRMLVDRLLPDGGCNYGNTWVLGQYLRPQIEPTGLTMLALADEAADHPSIERSLQYLTSAISSDTTPISLSYGLLGLAAHDRTPAAADAWLEAAYRRTIALGGAPLPIALLVLASQGRDSALIKLTKSQGSPSLGLQPS